MAIDWSKAPIGAAFYADGYFRMHGYYWNKNDQAWVESERTQSCLELFSDYCVSPYCKAVVSQKKWPETDERITAIAQNGNTGEHYDEVVPFVEWSKAAEFAKPTEPKTAVEFLNACATVQSERGKQYDASGTGERSFAAAASAFNAATGKSLTGSDVCLLLTMVKLVRQYSSPDRLHQDSLLDGVSYLSLWAEELSKELGK